MVPDDLVVCRCERVTAGDVKEALATLPLLSTRQSKLLTRVGMGFCQGRICRPVLDRLVAAGVDAVPESSGIRPRLPVRPVSLGVLSGSGDRREGTTDAD